MRIRRSITALTLLVLTIFGSIAVVGTASADPDMTHNSVGTGMTHN